MDFLAGLGDRQHHDPGHVGDRFYAGQRQHHRHERDPGCPGAEIGRPDVPPAFGQVLNGQRGQNRGYQYREDRNDEREGPGPLGADVIQRPQHSDRDQADERCEVAIESEWPPDVDDSLVRGYRGRDHIVGKQEQRADHTQHWMQHAAGGIHAAAVRIDAADHAVGPANQEHHRADCGHEVGGRRSGVEQRQAEHVQTAGSQVAKEHGTGQVPAQVARAIMSNQGCHGFCSARGLPVSAAHSTPECAARGCMIVARAAFSNVLRGVAAAAGQTAASITGDGPE